MVAARVEDKPVARSVRTSLAGAQTIRPAALFSCNRASDAYGERDQGSRTLNRAIGLFVSIIWSAKGRAKWRATI